MATFVTLRFYIVYDEQMANEIRKDYVLDRWVIIAKERVRRPTDFFSTANEEIDTEKCPFCPGNEEATPPAFLVYRRSDAGLRKDRDIDGERIRDWLVRCIPNLYPALSCGESANQSQDELHTLRDGIGSHEVIVESPHHNDHPANALTSQIRLVVEAYIDRLKALSEWDYVSIFRNHKREAGASLSHAHSQILAAPMVPQLIADEVSAHMRWFEKKDMCRTCEIIESERDSPRLIFENNSFIAIAPWASTYPFEFWILPKMHQATILQLEEREKSDLAESLKICLGSLAKTLNDPPYSYGFHLTPTKVKHERFHWHLEVYPKLTVQAGFENSTGMFINVTPPEIAAQNLRDSI
jgi:UDPglucose--hexose-1-phosphate uridylyltransferase